MGDVLRNSIPVNFISYGFRCKCFSFSGGCRIYDVSMELKREHNLNLVSMSKKGDTSFECSLLRRPQMDQFAVSSRMTIDDSVSVSNTVFGVDNEIVRENEEGKESIKREPDMYDGENSLQTSLSCCLEDSMIQQGGQGIESNGEEENRVHFLEERDEEMLSKRVLGLSKSNKIRSVLELFGSMKLSGLRPSAHACNSLLSCLLRNGRVDNALNVFEYMRTIGVTTGHTYSLMLKAIANTHGSDSAISMFVELERDVKLKADFDVIVYNTMISICGKVNNSVEAERIWRSMKDNGCTGTEITYSLLVSIFVRCGQNELALDAYSDMIRNGLTPASDALHATMGACTKEGRWDLGLEVFEKMFTERVTPNPIACNALINSLGKAGKVDVAFKVYGIMKHLGHEADEYTWNAMLSALYRANRHTNVLQLFDRIATEKRLRLNVHLYNTALMSCKKLRSWQRALQLLRQMEDSGLSVPTASYNLVISVCEIARKPKVALQVYEHMIHQKCTPDTFTHLSLLRSCIWGSLWDEVEEILNWVPPDVSLYNAALHGMCLRRKIKSAKKLYTRMKEVGLKPDGKTRALMLQNLRNTRSE